ncbi:hypothetical protein QFC21_003879 [Naganishia friedmannii]|uniref:Uncharacterized protein n=1 Tax=Naganishia friedmannii TaxID=89922 RepID=A0ACC2VL63_9TREE|nr:hypothetical protein QFC21_003879 [Naganishia friedmannii]
MPVKFCNLCSNLLYPKAAKGAHRKLYYACRNCQFETEANAEPGSNEYMVYRNELLSVVTEKAGVTDDVEMDPTLPRSNKECPNCHGTAAVYFQDQSKRRVTNMRLFYKCMQCLNVYKDPNAEEGLQKEAQRRQRDERVRHAANATGAKPAEKAKQPKKDAEGGPTALVNHIVVKDDNSDGEY